jgi:hypothetical protein
MSDIYINDSEEVTRALHCCAFLVRSSINGKPLWEAVTETKHANGETEYHNCGAHYREEINKYVFTYMMSRAAFLLNVATQDPIPQDEEILVDKVSEDLQVFMLDVSSMVHLFDQMNEEQNGEQYHRTTHSWKQLVKGTPAKVNNHISTREGLNRCHSFYHNEGLEIAHCVSFLNHHINIKDQEEVTAFFLGSHSHP